MTESEWTWTVGEETWNEPTSASREAAEADAREELLLRGYKPGSPFLVGRKTDVVPRMSVDLDTVMDQVTQQAYDLAGDVVPDYWPHHHRGSTGEALQAALDAVLRAYLEQHDPPSFWVAVEAREHRL